MTSEKTEKKIITPGKVVAFVIAGVAIYLIATLLVGFNQMVQLFSLIPLWLIPILLALPLANYVIRFFKWQYYLHRIGVYLDAKISFNIFLAGFTLTTTPGKIGETIKGYFVNQVNDEPIMKTATVVISERITDLLAMVILAMFGISAMAEMTTTLIVMGVLVLGLAIFLGSGKLYDKVLGKLAGLVFKNNPEAKAEDVKNTLSATLSPKPLLLSTLISVPGWLMECIALWLIVNALGFPLSINQAIFVHATASVVGAITFLPGGLGAAEFSASFLLIRMGAIESIAIASTILIRLLTLWYSVIVGFVALAIFNHVIKKRKQNNEKS